KAISLYISHDLGSPILWVVAFRQLCYPTFQTSSVPKISVTEDCDSVLLYDYVGAAQQICAIQTVSEPSSPEGSPQNNFTARGSLGTRAARGLGCFFRGRSEIHE